MKLDKLKLCRGFLLFALAVYIILRLIPFYSEG
jgi:hypothetical protein